MTAEAWQVGLAVGVQSAFGTINATIQGLSGSLGVSDGIVLGDRESGDGNSGITLPTLARISRDNADVSGSFTKQANSFLREEASSLALAWALKGNGATSTPAAGEAKPDAGIDALLQMAGLAGANGSSPTYVYTPASSSIYGTIKLWDADLTYVFQDCVLETLAIEGDGGEVMLAVANIRVGSVTSVASAAFPTFTYGTQASLSAPSLVNAAHAYGVTRGAQNIGVTLANNIVEIPDVNQPSGIRLSQDERSVDLSLLTEQDTAQATHDHDRLVSTSANTADVTFRLGVAAGASDTINGANVAINNLQVDSLKGDRAGDSRAEQIEGHATATAAGSEFTLTFD